ncbi:protein FAM177A1-like [Lingula anatina]|uniref:Protein FAM177A1-like n=1 Tax=Lingula anatina TaxID=7574 RepID=A0A2R2MPY3_LINAN|nr:protein FAM177A1-like [Lingula anatina]|eukprot:XP_023932299.1 protein FAM177A1-like [Lingula anatina]
MASAGEEAISPSNIVFEEKVDGETKDFTNIPLEENPQKKKKQPRRILHFSDGILEEYSTDEEEEEKDKPEPVDPKTLSWLPWLWFYFVALAVGALAVADYCGEKLAWFFGITTPKYQYAIDEYHRLREIEAFSLERRYNRLQLHDVM